METNLLELAKSFLTPEVIQRAGPLVGESPEAARIALDLAVPALVVGIAGEASSSRGAQRLFRTLDEAGLRDTLDTVKDRLGARSGEELIELGKDLLGRIFGPRLSPVIDATARASGVRTSAMASLLGLAAPIVLGVLGNQIHARRLDLDPERLARYLAGQKSAAVSVLPEGVASALGVGTATSAEARARPREGSGVGRLWPLLVVIPAIAAAFALRRHHATTDELVRGPGLGAGLPRDQAAPGAPAEGTTASELERFLGTPGEEPSRRFVLDDVRFDGARVTAGSRAAIDRVAVVLNEYPRAEVLLEGHTDDTGAPGADLQLSLARAVAVKSALVARGVASDRVAITGMGAERPIASSATEAGRALNRRLELIVTRR